MGKIKQVVLTATSDDMGGLDWLPELKAINDMIEGIELAEVPAVEGLSDDCAE